MLLRCLIVGALFACALSSLLPFGGAWVPLSWQLFDGEQVACAQLSWVLLFGERVAYASSSLLPFVDARAACAQLSWVLLFVLVV